VAIDSLTGNQLKAGPVESILVTAIEILDEECDEGEDENADSDECDRNNIELVNDNSYNPVEPALYSPNYDNKLKEEVESGDMLNLILKDSHNIAGFLIALCCFIVITILLFNFKKPTEKNDEILKDLDMKLIKGEITETEYVNQSGILK